ncbi:uncharacterized protein LOC127734546 isoform X2 [Mytilus californianus]|uniref:uncharacterized protein LOC127734546 isoform X2 n=1 Tax=Mytilus californianus TaxID=6549 RepID=UPI002247AE87|nr:uncharacterized protein LOC127734546 isoform X2 [Mytilus californianus]
MEKENRLKGEIIAMVQTIRGLHKTHTEILYRMTSNRKAWSLNVAAASNKIQKLEQHMQKVETQLLEDTSKLEEVTKDISNLMKDTSRLNVLVDNVRNYATCERVIGEKYETISNKPSSSITSQNSTSNTLGNHKSRIIFMENMLSSPSESSIEEANACVKDDACCSSKTLEMHIKNDLNNSLNDKTDNKIKHCATNINLGETLNDRTDANMLKSLKSINDETNITHHSISDFENLHTKCDKKNIQNDRCIENDKTSRRLSSEQSPIKNTCEKPIIQEFQTRTRKRENRYKRKTMKKQHDNRVSYHIKQECFKGAITNNVPTMDLQKVESFRLNIKPEETSMISQERFSTPRRRGRRSQDEDGLFDIDQPRTIREWIQYTNHIIDHASARMRSGLVKIGRSLDVILVLDTSERIAGYFQKLKSIALQYVYGIKQQFERTGIDNGIGIAIFGRQTRLIQEATNDYDLILELLGKIRPEGDGHIIGGLLMGLAGVVSCGVGYSHDTALQPHVIVFTNGSSEQNMPSVDFDDNLVVTFGNLRVKPDVNGVIDMIACTTTKIFYVPVGGNYHNITLEKAVRTTNGKLIPDDEIIRLTLMSKVLKMAMDVASEIRYSNNHSREVIRRKIVDTHNISDRYDDCLDMVQDFINPLKLANKQGKYVELKCYTLKLGDRVRRGPDWIYSDQDLDLPGTVVGQDLCGHDWKYGDFDGGEGSLGTVLEVKDKSKVVVRWDRTNKGIFKIGFNGLFEVKLCDDFVNKENTRRHIKPSNHSLTRQQNRHNLDTIDDDLLDCVITYSDILVSAIWEYRKSSEWTQYPSGINTTIEKAYQRKQTGNIIIEMDRTKYIIHFPKMIQENPQNKTEIQIRRKD